MRVMVALLAIGLGACGGSQAASVTADRAPSSAPSVVPTASSRGAVTPSSAPTAGVAELPPEPSCPSGTTASYDCTALTEFNLPVRYPPPFERCRISPMFSRQHTELQRQRPAPPVCCTLRCASSSIGGGY